MITSEQHAGIRAEHDSLPAYLQSRLTNEQLSRPLIVSFSQWEISTSTVGEIAANFHHMGLPVTVALWADETPVRDVGWTTSHFLARVFLSPARDQRLATALKRLGIPRTNFPKPPIRRWRPQEPLPAINGLNRTAIRQLRYRGANVGRAILQVHPDDQTPITDDHEWPRVWVEACLTSFAYAYDQTRELIRQRDSSCMVVFNGRFLHDAAAAAAATAEGIPVLSFDFGGNETDYDLTVDATHDWSALQTRMKDLYRDWDPLERDRIGSAWFQSRREHADQRNSLFVESQTLGRGINRPQDKTVVVFFSSSGDEISELDVEWGDYFYGQPGALEAVARICHDDDLFLVVRTHPHKRMKPARDVEDWHAAVARSNPDLHVDEWSDIDSYTLMDQADVVVTFGSTTGVEAAFARKPVIVMGPSAYDELGCASRVKNDQELISAIRSREAGDWPGAVSYGLMMNRRGFHHDHNGCIPRMVHDSLRDSIPFVLKLSDWARTRRAKAGLEQ